MHKVIFGSTIGVWLSSLAIILFSLVFAKLLYAVIQKYVKKAASKNKTKLDDIIIDMAEEPVIVSLVIFGLWVGLYSFDLFPKIAENLAKGYRILIVLNIAWFLNRIIGALIDEYAVPFVSKNNQKVDKHMIPIFKRVLRVIIWIAAIVLTLHNAGYDVRALIAGLGLGGLAFALAAKATLENLLGGITIFMDKPFSIDDRIKVKDFDGRVIEVGLRSTRLQTMAGRVVTIPNSDIVSNSIENISSEPARKVSATLGLAYGTSPEKTEEALALLAQISKKHEDSIVSEKTAIAFEAFGDTSLNLSFVYYIKKDADAAKTQTSINLNIQRLFAEKGIYFAANKK